LDLANAEILWNGERVAGANPRRRVQARRVGASLLKYIFDGFEVLRDALKLELEAERIKEPQIESLLGPTWS